MVIDTNIWIRRFEDAEYQVNCDLALSKFVSKPEELLYMDYEEVMLREYRDNLKGNRSFELFWKQLSQNGRISWVSSKLDHKHKQALLKRGFHEPEDHIFVGTAMNADHRIITDDSDYGANGEVEKQAVFEYMQEQMGLQVFSSQRYIDEG